MTRGTFIKTAGLIMGISFLLTGCMARELEERRFALALEVGTEDGNLVFSCAWSDDSKKITKVSASGMEEALLKLQDLQDKYVDYSQVKAVLMDESIEKNPEWKQETLRWLEETPEIARSILIYETDDLDLETVQKRSQGQPGIYLENLYKNNMHYGSEVRTLLEALYS